MKVRTVKRYYCDHCKKANLSRFHMAKHEKGCVRNPARICLMHQFAADTDQHQPEMADMHSAITAGGLTELRKIAHDCPACILAAITQYPWPPYPDDGRGDRPHPAWAECRAFEFKKERDELFAAMQDEREVDYESYFYG